MDRVVRDGAIIGPGAGIAQFVIATATGNNPEWFGKKFCAQHSFTSSSSLANVVFTMLPYITDAGAACGANINGWGANAGITVVAAAQLADTITSPLGTGWFDSAGLGIGAKCIFNSGTTNKSFGTGFYVVSPLWSNASGGCALP